MRTLLEQFAAIRAMWCADKSVMQIRDAEACAVYLQGLINGNVLNRN